MQHGICQRYENLIHDIFDCFFNVSVRLLNADPKSTHPCTVATHKVYNAYNAHHRCTTCSANTPMCTAYSANTPMCTAYSANTPMCTACSANTPMCTAYSANTPMCTTCSGARTNNNNTILTYIYICVCLLE